MRWVQSSVNALLGLRLPLDGIMGAETRRAIRAFQERQRLPADGVVGPDTERALIAARRSLASGIARELVPAGEVDEIRESTSQAETGVEVAGVALAAASLGVGVFQVVQSIATSGDLAVQADVARYVHQNTPANIPFIQRSMEFKISAHHPMPGFDRQQFYFRLAFEYNRYDLRNVRITVLRNKSSSLYASTLRIEFRASEYSLPSDPVAKILYTIQGRWDPAGPGDVSFEGQISVQADGRVIPSNIVSERNWVTWDGFVPGSQRDTPLALPSTPGLSPASTSGARPTLRAGARGPAVNDLQIRLNRWLVSQGRQPLVVDSSFGSATRATVIAFQRAARLTPDGVVGPKTWATLTKYW